MSISEVEFIEDLNPLKDEKQPEINMEAYTHHIYFFANPRSGDQTALKFINPKFHQFKVVFNKDESNNFGEGNDLSRAYDSKTLTS